MRAARYGPFGGRYVPETLVAPLEELERAYAAARADSSFQAELDSLLRNFAGRPTPLQFASRLTAHLGGPRIYIKREDLLHTGAHKINNALGQGLLAVRMGKKRVIAETGAGQHGVATATVAARLGLTCTVYMGTEDMERQRLNVFRMRLLGAEVVGVDSGSRTLKDAINEAMRDWVTNVRRSHYLLGSVLGAHPYPQMVRDFQKVIGEEAREQILQAEGRLPDTLIACVGGGSNAIGLFHAFLARCAGENDRRGSGRARHNAGRTCGAAGGGQRFRGRAAGRAAGNLHLRFADVRRPDCDHAFGFRGTGLSRRWAEHAWLAEQGRAEYSAVSDDEAVEAARTLARLEGIIPALESAHALAELIRRAPRMKKDELVILNLSGRGDKDMEILSRYV